MRNNLSIKGVGLSISAVLAVPYLLVMFASQLLVSFLKTGSWQAAFLEIQGSILMGFELGLLAVTILGFGVAVMFLLIYHTRARPRARGLNEPLVRSRGFRLMAAYFLLPPIALGALRILAPIVSPGPVPGGASAQASAGKDHPVNLGSVINTAFREAEPSFTADGRTMYFNCHSSDICTSHLLGTWESGSWTPPERLEAPVSTEYEEIEPVINGAGDKLYFTSNRPGGLLGEIPFLSPLMNVFQIVNTLAAGSSGDSPISGLGLGDVWVSYLVDGAWSEPQNLNAVAGEPPINTPFDDHCLFFSSDGNEAFWTSTRPGGFGGDDIWTSERVDGKWTKPENLGPLVNGPGSEHTSIPAPDGHSLYVTTTRPSGYGGEDNYITTRSAEGSWGPLVNLGPLVNGPGDDRCPAWTPDGKIFLFDTVRAGGFGGRDIWWVNFGVLAGASPGTEPAAALP